MKNRITQGLLVASLMAASAGAWAENSAVVKTAVQAMHCQPAGPENNFNGTCPIPAELYASDPVYKKDMETSLKAAGLKGLLGPEGALNGPQSPMESVKVAGKIWLKSMACEANNCGEHYLNFLYQPDEHQVLGYYFDGKGVWVGKPNNEEASILTDGEIKTGPGESDTAPVATAPASAPASPDAPPANTIWTFSNNGTTLWQACGGQNSACVIVGNSKWYVAVLNRRSATGCAFGDFYVADRSSTSWHQYDTGTCSADANIQQGSISHGQYSSVDILINGSLVKQFPIGYWSAQKSFSGGNRPSWSKAKQKNQH
ncbi:TPA: Ivy family c-type lysozyme inhibitor [Salmonella enterica subsp. salamae]